ncbi:hypothetical protein TNCV_2359812 [Trichonephila clavipes]|nr:hypothetical protein TNCV_2359812 [Trichonephila clavipes]
MAPYRRKTPAPTDYTTDEEDMITYNVEEDELEEHPNLVQKEAMPDYTNEEYTDMHLMDGRTDCIGRLAHRMYQDHFPERRFPHHTTFKSYYLFYDPMWLQLRTISVTISGCVSDVEV